MKRVLFVDDEQNLLDGLRRTLYPRRQIWEMHFAAGGEAALAASRTLPFDVVVSDLKMPGMDGADLLQQMRNEFPETARVILSGYADEATISRAVPVAYRVLSKPCDVAELTDTIMRFCQLQDLLGSESMRRVIGRITRLPSASNFYMRLNKVLGDEHASAKQVASVIETDVAVSAKILQLANSGFFAHIAEMRTVEQAVQFLGRGTLRMVALTTDAFRMIQLDQNVDAHFVPDVLRQCLRAATIAGQLPAAPVVKERAVVAALLHDIGELMLVKILPTETRAIDQAMQRESCPRVEAEKAVLGTTHAELGAYLMGLWGINTQVVEAIANHHIVPLAPGSPLDCSQVVRLSAIMASHIEERPDDLIGEHLPEIVKEMLISLGVPDQYVHYRERAIAAAA